MKPKKGGSQKKLKIRNSGKFEKVGNQKSRMLEKEVNLKIYFKKKINLFKNQQK